MYLPCILYSLLSGPTNAKHKKAHTHIYLYIHIYINDILHIVSIPTRFIASASSSESPILLDDDADASKHLGILKRYIKFS